MERAIGIDLGGTRIKAVVINADGELMQDQYLSTSDGDDQSWKQAVSDLVLQWRTKIKRYLLQWQDRRVLIDPYLSDSLTKKYEHTHKPHIRISERVIDPEILKNISIVTSSHNHTDHLDAETLIPILNNNPGISFVIPEANRSFVSERVHSDKKFPLGLNAGQSLVFENFTFHGIPAKHNEIEKDENGFCKYLGYVIEFGPWKIYHSGDFIIHLPVWGTVPKHYPLAGQ